MKISRIKNQLVITVLVLMIAAGGYLSFYNGKDRVISPVMGNEIASGEASVKDTKKKTEKEDMEDAGEAVITSGKASTDYVANTRLNREQAHAKARDELKQMIQDDSLSQEAKDNASKELIEMTKNQDAEVAIESLLQAKGFKNVVVSIMNGNVDVVVDLSNVSEVQLAQIEEIVTRKVEIDPAKIVVTPMRVE